MPKVKRWLALRKEGRRSPEATDEGFTLIELLVVISIIGILAAFITTNFLDARHKARDVQRKSDTRQIAVALDVYYNTYGRYPSTGDYTAGFTSYLKNNTIPADPGGQPYRYETDALGSRYTLWAKLENCGDQAVIAGQCDAPYNYAVGSN